MSQWNSPASPDRSALHASTAETRSGRAKGSIIAAVSVLAVLLIVAGLFVAGSFDTPAEQENQNQGGDPRVDPSRPSASAEPEEIPEKTLGTPENPHSPGDSFTVEDWTFTIGKTDTDAWPELAPRFERDVPENIEEFQPLPGMVFVSVPMSMTYTGPPETQDLANSHGLSHIATDGTQSLDGSCGVAVKRYDTTAYATEPSAEGTSCVEIPPTQVPGGLWRVHLAFADNRWIEAYFVAE